MSYTVTAKLHEIGETQVVSERFKKREFVVITERLGGPTVYTEFIKFQIVQDYVNLLDEYNVGDMVEVSFDLKGRKWDDPKSGETKYFTNLQAWKLSRATPQEQQQAAPVQVDNTPPNFPTAPPGAEPAGQQEMDDLPF